jgi:enoyl-CoA hydratase
VPDDELLDTAVAIAGRAASGPPELTRAVKRTIQEMGTVDTHPEAVAKELEVQLWSMDQPEFAERLAALQRRISGS